MLDTCSVGDNGSLEDDEEGCRCSREGSDALYLVRIWILVFYLQ